MKKSKEIIVLEYAFLLEKRQKYPCFTLEKWQKYPCFSLEKRQKSSVFILEKWKCFVVFLSLKPHHIQKKLLSLPMSR